MLFNLYNCNVIKR